MRRVRPRHHNGVLRLRDRLCGQECTFADWLRVATHTSAKFTRTPPAMSETMRPELFANMAAVVQYRRVDGLHGWIGMCAYDVTDLAIKYCDECSQRPRPWAYRVVDAKTGEPIHAPEPKERADV